MAFATLRARMARIQGSALFSCHDWGVLGSGVFSPCSFGRSFDLQIVSLKTKQLYLSTGSTASARLVFAHPPPLPRHRAAAPKQSRTWRPNMQKR
jgi:hypothetical protein